MAPPRKPEGQRARRNKVNYIDLPGDGSRPEWAVLPGWAADSVGAVAWWDAVWADPVSAMWTAADLWALARLAALHGHIAAGMLEDKDTLREMRMLEDRFFLNPKSRQVANIRTPDVPKPVAESPPKPQQDRRSRLQVV